MWKGRVAEVKKADERTARVLGRRLWDGLHLADERELASEAEEKLRAARIFRQGRGPRK